MWTIARTIFENLYTICILWKSNDNFTFKITPFSPNQGHLRNIPICVKTGTSFNGHYFQTWSAQYLQQEHSELQRNMMLMRSDDTLFVHFAHTVLKKTPVFLNSMDGQISKTTLFLEIWNERAYTQLLW